MGDRAEADKSAVVRNPDKQSSPRFVEVPFCRDGEHGRASYAVLDEHFELNVGNARHIRNVPRRMWRIPSGSPIWCDTA